MNFSRRTLLKAASSLMLPAVIPGFAHAADLKEVSHAALSMGTLVTMKLYGSDEVVCETAADAALAEMERIASEITVHADESSLLSVIRHSGEKTAVTPDVAAIVRQSLAVAQESGQAFEPTIGKLVDVWKIGFGGSRVPSESEIREALSFVDYRKVQVTEEAGEDFIQIARGQDLDMGGIAKGYIGTKMAEVIAKTGVRHALISLGGNVVLVGNSPSGRSWNIGLQDPREERNGYFAVLQSEDESVVTSGAYERYMKIGGKSYGHILSARTGYPAETDLSSVTVIDKDGAKADAWCTAFFALGCKETLEILRRRADIEAVLLSADAKTVWMTPGAAARCTVTDRNIMERVVIGRAA